MCAAQAAPPGPPPPPGAGARVADTAPQTGGHLHKGRAAGPARGPRGPALRQRRCRPMRLGSARYPLVREERKKGRNEGRGAGGGRRRRHLRRVLLLLLLSAARPQPNPAEPALPVRAGAGGISLPQRRQRHGPARPGSAPRARAPTSLAHPPRGGRDGVGGRRSSREIRSEPPREFSNARDTASGADGGGLRTTVPGMPRGSSFRSRPGGGLSFAAHAGSCSSWAARTGARQSPFLAPAPHLVGTALVPCPVKAEPPAGRKLALRTCIRLTAGAAHPLLRLPPLRLSGFH